MEFMSSEESEEDEEETRTGPPKRHIKPLQWERSKLRTITTLNFRKFKVALNSMYRIFLNFAKICILSCLSKFHNKKKFHRAVFEI